MWRFENAALTVDSKGTNTLVSHGAPAADVVDFQEGAASVNVPAIGDYFDITDANLDAGFPLKNGDANKKISFSLWVKLAELPAPMGASSFCMKIQSATVYVYNNMGTSNIGLRIRDPGFTDHNYFHATAVVINRWYHLGVTYQDSDKAYRIRIWDDTAGAIHGVDLVGIGHNIIINNLNFQICEPTPQDLVHKTDEVVIFDRVLSVADIDAIRSGSYGAGGAVFGSLTKPLSFAQHKVGVLTEL